MKTSFLKTLPVLALVLLCASSASAAEVKIATIDLKKIFDNYWKTKQATANLEQEARELEKQRKGLLDDFEKAKGEYSTLLATTNDSAVSADEREKRKKAAEAKLREIQGIEQSVRQFDNVALNQIDERKAKMREKIVDEISDVIKSKSKAAGFSLVLDIKAETINRTPAILFSNGENDITDEILNQLNSTAPAGALKPPEPKPGEKK